MEEKPLTKDFKRFTKILNRYAKGGKLLELGAAYGFSLNQVKPHFDEVVGIEINREAADYGRKNFSLDLRHGDFLKMDLPDNYFDVVTCWATLEHLPTAHLYMQKIAKILKPGGLFAATTIDIDSFVPRFRKEKWRQIHPPTHVSYYSKKTLIQLMEKYGLKTIYSDYFGQYRSFDNVFHGIFVLLYKKDWIYNLLKKFGLTKGIFYLNLYDLIYVVARKQST